MKSAATPSLDEILAENERLREALGKIRLAVYDVWDSQFLPQDRLTAIEACASTALGDRAQQERS